MLIHSNRKPLPSLQWPLSRLGWWIAKKILPSTADTLRGHARQFSLACARFAAALEKDAESWLTTCVADKAGLCSVRLAFNGCIDAAVLRGSHVITVAANSLSLGGPADAALSTQQRPATNPIFNSRLSNEVAEPAGRLIDIEPKTFNQVLPNLGQFRFRIARKELMQSVVAGRAQRHNIGKHLASDASVIYVMKQEFLGAARDAVLRKVGRAIVSVERLPRIGTQVVGVAFKPSNMQRVEEFFKAFRPSLDDCLHEYILPNFSIQRLLARN